jgi:transcription initiation factor TFIIB
LTLARHDRGLNTEIGRGQDGNGNRLSQNKRRTLNRLRTQHSRAQFESKADRNLAHACGEIARLTSTLDLSRARREEASTLYRQAQQQSLIRGRSIESMAAGSVYSACRCSGTVLTVPQIAEVTSCSTDTVWNAYGVLNTKLDLDVPVRQPQAFVAMCASDCDTTVPSSVRHHALELTTVAEETGLANGRHPAGVAAACLYRAGNEAEISLTQTDLAEAASVTPGTIRKRRNELQTALGDA